MVGKPRQRGFTLVEMLVVIAIIVLLMAILFPVFATARRKAREAQCWSRLHQLAVALKEYHDDHGRYPGPPMWNGTRYVGGFSDLYPDYIDSTQGLLCPEDRTGRRLGRLVKDRVYCSYNGLVDPINPIQNPDFVIQNGRPQVWYNYNGYDVVGDVVAQPFASTGVDHGGTPAAEAAYLAALQSDYAGTPHTLRDAPRLRNRKAPGNTIITHCIHHRGSNPDSPDARDFVMRVDGSKTIARHVQWDQDPDGAGPKAAQWIGQTE